ncbi:MAG: heavy-metal-associated domain-containing protein [Chloroflexota bacterium]
MCCTTCAALIRHGLTKLPGVRSVQIVVRARRVTVQWHAPTTWRDIERQLDASGYPPGPPLV